MQYKGKMLLEIPRETGRDLMEAVKATGKFVKDAFLTEVVPRELKSKLKNYNLPDSYIKAVRPFLKLYGGFLAGSVTILLTKDSNLSSALLKANPSYLYGLGDGVYDLMDGTKSTSYLPPATLVIELPYSYFSNLYKKVKPRENI